MEKDAGKVAKEDGPDIGLAGRCFWDWSGLRGEEEELRDAADYERYD